MKSGISVLERAKFRMKIQSLADESRAIRERVKRLGKGWKFVPPGVDLVDWWRCYDVASAQGSLTHHRTHDVRFEARHTLLAYAYRRGVPYRVLEKDPDSSPNVFAIVRIVKPLGWLDHSELARLERDISDWVGVLKFRDEKPAASA